MKIETKARLRAAAIEALRDNDDDGALELLALMGDRPSVVSLPQEPRQLALMSAPAEPPLPQTQDARDVHAWAMAIEQFFLPSLTSRGRTDFTTPEMLSWFESSGFPLTVGDLEVLPGQNRVRWRGIAGNGLTKLRESGCVFQRGYFSKTYTTVRPVGLMTAVEAI
jgi:hypothetical protein